MLGYGKNAKRGHGVGFIPVLQTFFFICTERIFHKDIVFSCMCDYFFSLFVTTITLERLNQSEPNFHT